jgi:pimeloyl-ACP methyl ester carboxylesterase
MSATGAASGGSADPLVLIHGFSGSRIAWSLVREHLAGCDQVLAVDLVGHAGGRPLPAGTRASVAALVDGVEQDMESAGLDRAHLVGSSLGGWIALELAERGRARSVVALSPAGGWEPGSEAERRLSREVGRTHALARMLLPVAGLLVRSAWFRRRMLAQVAIDGSRVPPAMAAQMIRDTVECSIYFPLAEAIGRDGPPTLERVDCPVLVLWGARDALLPPAECSARLRAMLPLAEWVELPELGHAPMYDDPELVAHLISGFVGRVSTADPGSAEQVAESVADR